jgi:RNA polymerase sigma-70 factor (ECF subfamily)
VAEAHARVVRIPTAARNVPSQQERTREDARANDDRLMAALGDDTIEALERLYDRYSALVYSVALRILHDHVLAEDVTQEVFLRLWRRPQSYDPARGRFVSWLMSITRNRALDEQRRVSRRLRLEETGEGATDAVPSSDRFDDPVQAAAIGDERAAVRAAMETLSPQQRRVIELAYFGGLTQVEIAALTNTPLGTVKTRVRLAMSKLRVALHEIRPLPHVDPSPEGTPPEGRTFEGRA